MSFNQELQNIQWKGLHDEAARIDTLSAVTKIATVFLTMLSLNAGFGNYTLAFLLLLWGVETLMKVQQRRAFDSLERIERPSGSNDVYRNYATPVRTPHLVAEYIKTAFLPTVGIFYLGTAILLTVLL
jgi:hypothetical protein